MPGQAIITISDNQWVVNVASNHLELAQGLEGVGFGRGLVVTYPGYARKAQRQARLVLAAGLDLVKEHLDHDPGLNRDRRPVHLSSSRVS